MRTRMTQASVVTGLTGLLLLALPTVASAAPPLQESEDGWGAFSDWAAAWLNDLFIELMKAIATAFWFLEKIAAGITRFLIDADMWSTILITLLGSLRGVMPEVLRNLLFSTNGAGGLLYLALMLAGILMILPQIGQARLVDPGRVILWGAIVVALFASPSLAGYDLIGLLEQIREGAVQVVVGAVSDTDSIDDLVKRPMMATDEEIQTYSFELAEDFEETYFPEEREYERRRVTFIESPFFTWDMELEVESEESQRERREKAQTGLAIAALTLVPGWVLFSFGVVFATLTAAALVLIVFFLVALPLGFFEFGAPILTGIVKQYGYLFAITLLATILPGLLVAAGALAFPEGGPPDPAAMMGFIPILLVVAVATQYIGGMAWSAMTGTFGIVSASIRSSLAPLAYVGPPPTADGLPGTGSSRLLATTALAAATGGASAALAAGAGALLANTNREAANAAAWTAVATGRGEQAHVFAAAARGRGMAGTAAGIMIATNRFRLDAERAGARRFAEGITSEAFEPGAEWPAQDAGAFLLADRTHLERAEQAHQAGHRTTARHHLEEAFGSRELAEEVLAVYDRRGEDGREQVRQIVTITQAVATELASAGEPVFTSSGTPNAPYREALSAALHREGRVNLRDLDTATFAGRVAGAAVRAPVGIWAAPESARLLAQAVVRPEEAPAQTEDAAAQYRLHAMARQVGWGEDELAVLFEAVRQGQAAASQSGRSIVDETVDLLAARNEFRDQPLAEQREAARLGVMVAERAWVMQPAEVELGTPPPSPWDDPDAARRLAQEVLRGGAEPAEIETPVTRLHALATHERWSERQLEALFEAVQRGQAGASRPGHQLELEILTALAAQGEWQKTPLGTRRRAANLALEVVQAQSAPPSAQTGTTPPPADQPSPGRESNNNATEGERSP